MTKYFINLRGVSTEDPKFNKLLGGGEMRIEFTRDEFSVFHKCATLWIWNNNEGDSAEWLEMWDKCSNLIYNKLDEYYAKLREVVCLESVETPFVMFESWDIDNSLFDTFDSEHE